MRFPGRLMILTLVLLPAAPVAAGLVQPGQSVPLTSDQVPAPKGTLLDQKLTPFVIDYGAPSEPFNFSGKLTGRLYSAVYRDAGRLTFVYDIDLDHQLGFSGASEASELRVGSFKSFNTALFGSMDFETLVRGSRSPNGSQLWLNGSSPGLGGSPRMIIKTDATAYDANGHASFSAADEVPTLAGARLAAGSASFGGMFRPIHVNGAPPPIPPAAGAGLPPSMPGGSGGGGVGPGPTPTPIPLPPAVFSALGVLLAMGLILLTRRGWAVRA